MGDCRQDEEEEDFDEQENITQNVLKIYLNFNKTKLRNFQNSGHTLPVKFVLIVYLVYSPNPPTPRPDPAATPYQTLICIIFERLL